MFELLYILWMIIAAFIVMFFGGAILGIFIAGIVAMLEKLKRK